jgi:Flp pilus assembly secretin CpaC
MGIVVLIAAIFLCGGPYGAEMAGASEILALGEQKTLPLSPSSRFSVGNPEVIQVKAIQAGGGAGRLLVKAKAQGYSDLLLIDGAGKETALRFRVVNKKQALIAQEIGTDGGASIQPLGSLVQTKGLIKDLQQWKKIQFLTLGKERTVFSGAQLHPEAKIKAMASVQQILRETGNASHISARFVGDQLVLRGDAGSLEEKKLVESAVTKVLGGVISHIKVPFERERTFYVQARVVELLKGEARELGFDWTENESPNLKLAPRFFKLGLGWHAELKALEKKGAARLLAEPKLTVNEKGPASLLVGGEIPLPFRNRSSSGVQWKEYGLLLSLQNQGFSQGRLRTKVKLENSSLQGEFSREGGPPAIRKSSMETQVDLSLDRALMLSGLMEARSRQQVEGLPFLKDLPILGALFSSEDFQESRSELAIFLQLEESQDNRL